MAISRLIRWTLPRQHPLAPRHVCIVGESCPSCGRSPDSFICEKTRGAAQEATVDRFEVVWSLPEIVHEDGPDCRE